jgi:hypothetical protein
MMLVKCQVRPSAIHGYGCFAEERIAKGTLLWKYLPEVDQVFTTADLERCSPALHTFFQRFACHVTAADHEPELTGRWILCMDAAAFMNQHESPNFGADHRAIRDILAGEEIVCLPAPSLVVPGAGRPGTTGVAGP